MMSEHEDGRVERRVDAPPALPVGVLVPSGIAELAGSHDLGANSRVVLADEGVVHAAAATRRAGPFLPPPRLEHPFVQPFAGMAKRRIAGWALARSETVERDGEVLNVSE